MIGLYRLYGYASFGIGLLFLKDVFKYTDILPALIVVAYFLFFVGVSQLCFWFARRAHDLQASQEEELKAMPVLRRRDARR